MENGKLFYITIAGFVHGTGYTWKINVHTLAHLNMKISKLKLFVRNSYDCIKNVQK